MPHSSESVDPNIAIQDPSAKTSAFRFTRIENGKKRRARSLAEFLGNDELSDKSWLFVSPHDDDLCLSAGLWIQAAVQAGIDVHAVVVTDGCLGYCSSEQEDSIVATRRQETYDSFAMLGVDREHVTYIDYPDGGLIPYLGRRKAEPGEHTIAGHTGLQNAFTYYLRQIRPSHVFVPTSADLHPDHRHTHSELMISLFHASGAIWPELGAPLIEVPRVCELAVYCDFPELPNLEIASDKRAFERKLQSIEAFQSQEQISALIENAREAGPFEYVREVNFRLYSPRTYKKMFA